MVVKRIKLLEYQLVMEKSKKRIRAMVSGTGAGKTYYAGWWSIEQAVQGPQDSMHFALAPTVPLLKLGLWNHIKQWLRNLGMKEGVHYHMTEGNDHSVRFFHNNSIIYGRSMHDPHSIQGGHAHSVVLDEAGLMSDECFKVAKQRTAFFKAPILITTTPYTWNWLKTEVYDPWKKAMDAGVEHDKIDLVNVRSIDNPYYNVEEYEYARATLPAWYFDMFYNGLFTRPLGRIYELPSNTYVTDIPPLEEMSLFAGLDFGYTHPTGIVFFGQHRKTGVVYIIDVIKKSGLDLDQLITVIKSYPHQTYYCDTAEADNIATLAARGIDARKAVKSVNAGIMFCQSQFLSGNLKIYQENSLELDKEIASYSWKLDAADKPIDTPIKSNDDVLDAMRYGLYTRLYQPPQPLVKPAAGQRRSMTPDFFKGF